MSTLSSCAELSPTRMGDGESCGRLASVSQPQVEAAVPSVGEPLLSRDRGTLWKSGGISRWKAPDSLTVCLVFDGDTDGVS